jgi:hypothetical protein
MATDSFDRADNVDLGTEWDHGYGGDFPGSMGIVSNAAQCNANAVSGETYNVQTASDMTVEVVFSFWDGGTSGLLGVFTRFSAPTDTVGYCMDGLTPSLGNTTQIVRYDSTVSATLLASEAVTNWDDGNVFLGSSIGSSHLVKRNGATLIGPVTDATYTTGRAGICGYAGTTLADKVLNDFTFTNLSSHTGLLVTNRWTW